MDDAGACAAASPAQICSAIVVQPRPRAAAAPTLARERLAVDELHRQELVAAVLADVEHARDVAVLDPPRQLDLAAEPLDRVLGQPAAQAP